MSDSPAKTSPGAASLLATAKASQPSAELDATRAPSSPSREPPTGGLGPVTPEAHGRYDIRREQGSGGMGRVLVAFDRHVGREVALKELLIQPGAAGWAAEAARFVREARLSGVLEHPNIVPVHEVGLSESGSFYYTMKLVRGRTLAQALQEAGSLAARMKLLGSLGDLANAIAFAHSREVLHRDIKPQNVMVGEFGETVLLDWGLAKFTGQQDGGPASRTVSGAVLGTPAYMSPEQAAGKVDEIDQRSDVWGLGAVLYELITGRPPFACAGYASTITAVINEPLQPVLELCPEAPPELAAIAEKALRKEKAARYQSAKELADDVAAFMTGGTVSAYRYTSWDLVKGFARRHRTACLSAAIILALILVGSLLLFRAWRSEGSQRARAEQNEAEARSQGLEAEANLSRAMQQKAETEFASRSFLEARLYAAASLLHNPANPEGARFAPSFDASHPGALELRTSALSMARQAEERSLLKPVRRSAVTWIPPVGAGDTLAWNGADLALVADDGPVHLSDERGRARTLEDGRLTCAAVSGDGKLVAAGGTDGRVRVWTEASSGVSQRLGEPGSPVVTVAISPDGRSLAAGFQDGHIALWDAARGTPKGSWKTHQAEVFSLAFSASSQQLASGAGDGTIALRGLGAHGDLSLWQAHGAPVTGLSFSSDGSRIASAGIDALARIWDAQGHKPLATLPLGDEGGSIGFSLDATLLLTSAGDGILRLWEARTFTLVQSVRAHRGTFQARFSPDGRRILSSGSDRQVRLWEVDAARMERALACDDGQADAVEVSPDGARVATAGYGASICVWRMPQGVLEARLPGHRPLTWALRFLPQADTLLSNGGPDGHLAIWDLATRQRRELATGFAEADLVPMDGGATLAFTLRNVPEIRFVDLASGRVVRTLAGYRAVAVSPDHRWLATSSLPAPTRLLIYDLASGELARSVEANADGVWSAAFSPDGRWLATGGLLGKLLLWDTASYRDPRSLVGHGNWINRLDFSSDGSLLASASDDRTARLWSVKTGEDLWILRSGKAVVQARFTPDARSILMTDESVVRRYSLASLESRAGAQALLDQAQADLGLRLEGFDLVPLE